LKALGSASSSSEGDDAQPEEEPSSTASPPSSKRSIATSKAAARGGGGVPVAIELYPLAVRDDTTATATTSPMYKHGKIRRRKRHHDAAAATATTTTTTTISAGGRLQQEDGTEGEEDVEAVASAAAPDAAAEEDAADGAADRAPDGLDDVTAAVSREDTSNTDHATANDDDDNVVLEPFPTLYWLTHPLLRILVSQLEVEGWGRQLEERLRNDAMAQQSMRKAHAHYGSYRYQLLTEEDLQLLKERNWEAALCPDTRGVAGIVFAGEVGSSGSKRGTTSSSSSSSLSSRLCSVKCLHAHAAHYLSAHRRPAATTAAMCSSTSPAVEGCDRVLDNGGDDNVVGKWVMELIQERLLLGADSAAARPAAAAAGNEL
jgi:hypothetical protein